MERTNVSDNRNDKLGLKDNNGIGCGSGKRIALAVMFVFASAIVPVNAAYLDIIYQDSFDTEDSNVGLALNGRTPDITSGSTTWVSNTQVDPAISSGEAQFETRNQTAFLPFAPTTGNQYELTADITFSGTGGFLGIGFSSINGTHSATTNDPYLRQGHVGALEAGAESGSVTLSVASVTAGEKINYAILLDTRPENWIASYYVDGALAGTHTYTSNPTIVSVRLLTTYHGSFSSGSFDNFQLATIPEPASAMLFGLAMGTLLLRRRRRRN